jgi:hypothetical protein
MPISVILIIKYMHEYLTIEKCVVRNHLWPLNGNIFYSMPMFGTQKLDLAPPRGNDDDIDWAIGGWLPWP